MYPGRGRMQVEELVGSLEFGDSERNIPKNQVVEGGGVVPM